MLNNFFFFFFFLILGSSLSLAASESCSLEKVSSKNFINLIDSFNPESSDQCSSLKALSFETYIRHLILNSQTNQYINSVKHLTSSIYNLEKNKTCPEDLESNSLECRNLNAKYQLLFIANSVWMEFFVDQFEEAEFYSQLLQTGGILGAGSGGVALIWFFSGSWNANYSRTITKLIKPFMKRMARSLRATGSGARPLAARTTLGTGLGTSSYEGIDSQNLDSKPIQYVDSPLSFIETAEDKFEFYDKGNSDLLNISELLFWSISGTILPAWLYTKSISYLSKSAAAGVLQKTSQKIIKRKFLNGGLNFILATGGGTLATYYYSKNSSEKELERLESRIKKLRNEISSLPPTSLTRYIKTKKLVETVQNLSLIYISIAITNLKNIEIDYVRDHQCFPYHRLLFTQNLLRDPVAVENLESPLHQIFLKRRQEYLLQEIKKIRNINSEKFKKAHQTLEENFEFINNMNSIEYISLGKKLERLLKLINYYASSSYMFDTISASALEMYGKSLQSSKTIEKYAYDRFKPKDQKIYNVSKEKFLNAFEYYDKHNEIYEKMGLNFNCPVEGILRHTYLIDFNEGI